MKIDRGIIKWQPFNSVAPSKEIIYNLSKKRQKISKPILSEEQLQDIQSTLLEAYTNGLKVYIEYYKNGIINKIEQIIKKIDIDHHCIILTNNNYIYFNQIIKIKSI